MRLSSLISPVRLARLFLFLPFCVTAAATGAAAEDPTAFLARLEEATATNNRAELASLLANPPPAPSGPTAQAYHLALIRAQLDLGQFDLALQRYFAAGAPPEQAWLAGIAFCYKRNWERVDAAIGLHTKADPRTRPPAVPFLEALRAHLRAADFAHGDPQVDQLRQQAQSEAAAAVAPAAQQHPGFDPRFFRLALLVAAQSGDPTTLAQAAHACSRAFPRHPGYARMAREADRDVLAEAFARHDDPDALRARLAESTVFSAEEAALWHHVLDTRKADHPTELAGHHAAFRQLPDRPEFVRPRLIFLRTILRRPAEEVAAWLAAARGGTLTEAARAELAGYFAHSDPALSELSSLYVRLAAATGSYVDARAALDWLDLRRALPLPPAADSAETELQLSRGLNDHPRSLRLILALTPAHRGDADWLNQHRSFITQAAPLTDALRYLRQLESLRPDDPALHLALAGLASRPGSAREFAALVRNPSTTEDHSALTDSSMRIAYYERAFALVPQRFIPESQHWEAYRELLCERDRMLDFANTGTMGRSPASTPAFDQLVERSRAAAPHALVIAEQYASLLLRRAQAAPDAETIKAARAALRLTEELGPDPVTYRATRTQLTKLETALDEKARLARLEQRDRALQAETQRHLQRSPPAHASSSPGRARQDLAQIRRNIAYRSEWVRKLPYTAKGDRELGDFLGNSTPAGKAAKASAAEASAAAGNLCRPCQGLGLKVENRRHFRCPTCSGTGKKDPQGAGPSAGFENFDAVTLP